MELDTSKMAISKQSAIKTLYGAFKILNENGGEMQRKLLIEEMNKQLVFEPWEIERYESNGQLKWLTIFLFYTIDCIKAGWLIKIKGLWFLTPEGKNAISLGPIKMFETANKAYREWKSGEIKGVKETEENDVDISDEQVQKATLDELEAQATESIGKYLEQIDSYKFQKIAAVLLKVMGLHIDYIAPLGPDGGIDIIAYKDPLGFQKPRIKVQVKNYNEKNKVDVKTIRELRGLLNANEHIGIFITSGYFTKEAEIFARQSDIHIKLINRDSFIELWQHHYYSLNEEEKSLLPMHPIYFLGNIES